MKTTKWSLVVVSLLFSTATVSFGQGYRPGYGRNYPDNGYGQNYQNGYPNPQNCPNPAYANGYGQVSPYRNYPPTYSTPYGQYDQYGRPYPPVVVQPPVVVGPPRVVVVPPPVVVSPAPIVVRPYSGYGYRSRGGWGGRGWRRW